MTASSRFLSMIAAIALSTTIAGAALANPSASIEQVRNGPATATTTPTPTWGSGNAGASNSHYLESHSSAYRAIMTDLPTNGTVVELVIGYDVKRSGSYAIDYLTHYQRLLPHVLFGHNQPEVFDPLSGVTGVGSTVTTAPIPVPTRNLVVDPDGAGSDPAAPQPSTSMTALPGAEKVMTLFGGTLIDVSYVTEGDVALATGSSETQVKVRFTANSPTAVLAWGGHLGCRWDWGFNSDGSPRSAGGISGSSYHMKLVTWSLGSLGNQDRSMSTDAVFPVPTCAISNQGPFCAGSTNTHSAPPGMETYRWSLFDNTSGASIVGSDTSLSVVVRNTTGGSYSVLLVTGASGFTKQCQATVTVKALVTANAGPDQVVCATSPQVQLAGSVGNGATTGTWSGGAGTFSPNATSLNAIYTPTASEVTAGAVTLTLTTADPSGTCPGASDQVRIAIERVTTANAGADLIVCASSPQAQLAGSVGSGATSGTWSGGAGTFSPGATALNAVYTPSAGEMAAGGVTLTLTTNDPAGPCTAVSDQMRITINPAATANAGADRRVCSSSPSVQLAGSVGGGATSGTWSGGAGTFSPNASALNATYTPTAAEIASGSVTLTLTTNDPAGPCPAVSDQMRITIDPSTIVNAGPDKAVCSSSPQVQLQGSVSGTVTSGTWSGGAGTFSPSATVLNATYTPSAAEIAAGTVTLRLTSAASSGPCAQASDEMKIVISKAVTVNAGPDQIVCSAFPQVRLAGSLGGGATGGTWTGGAGTFSSNATTLSALYVPTPAEIESGSLTLTLTTNDPAGPCPAVSDQMRITFNKPAVMVPDRVVCSGITPATLCANPQGVAPYTYLWNTGATSQCITVSDTGSYTVAMTDSKGCKATGSGAFRYRECVGMLAHTVTTCASFMDGTGQDFNEVHYVTRDNIITSISPGVFFYYTKVAAPSADFTVNIVQTRDNTSFPFCSVQQGQVSLYDSDCNRIASGTETRPGQASVDIHGATVGQVFIISVKYSLKDLIDVYLDPAKGVHYDFRTEINGQIVDRDPDGLQIGQPAAPALADVPPSGTEEPVLFRPSPNPFSEGMRMAYAVSSTGEQVSIGIYDLAGRLVRTLASGYQTPGRHLVAWDGRDEQGTRMRGGIYFVHSRVGNQARQVRVTFLR